MLQPPTVGNTDQLNADDGGRHCEVRGFGPIVHVALLTGVNQGLQRLGLQLKNGDSADERYPDGFEKILPEFSHTFRRGDLLLVTPAI